MDVISWFCKRTRTEKIRPIKNKTFTAENIKASFG
jgi:hypothetical protein